jgi:large subunit ribosomal protein L17
VAERLVTLGKRGDLHARRQAAGFLRQKEAVSKLFADVAPACSDRQGGYCRIVKLGPRFSDSAPMAYIEWVDLAVEVGEIEDEESEESEEAEE